MLTSLLKKTKVRKIIKNYLKFEELYQITRSEKVRRYSKTKQTSYFDKFYTNVIYTYNLSHDWYEN